MLNVLFLVGMFKNNNMKRKLFFALVLVATVSISAQIVANDNFNALNLGYITTDVSGNSAGQGGYYIYGGAFTDYQITSIDTAHGNSLKVISGSGYDDLDNSPNVRFAFKPFTVNATAGNDIIKGTFDIYTGPATGKGMLQIVLYDDNGIGITGVNYDYATKKINGMARLVPAGSTETFYSVGLGVTMYPANTWVTVGFTYNKTTGSYSWTDPGGIYTLTSTTYPGFGVVPGMVSAEYDVVSSTDPGNTVANEAAVDNVNILYTNNATLGTSDVIREAKIPVSIYPNPVSDVLTVLSDKTNNIEIFDMNGRKMNVNLDGNKVDVRNLNPGSYIISIETKEGKTTEKFIKK